MITNFNIYNNTLLLEKFDDNLKSKLKEDGYSNEEIEKILYKSHRGKLSQYLRDNGQVFTFGLLKAIWQDANIAKKNKDITYGSVKMVHRLIPIFGGMFLPILSLVGTILGTTRAVDKVIKPILADNTKSYPEFLKKILNKVFQLVEGELDIKDRFLRSFVVRDGLLKMLNQNTIENFYIYIVNEIENKDDNEEVPSYYIENELRKWLNEEYQLNPKLLVNR